MSKSTQITRAQSGRRFATCDGSARPFLTCPSSLYDSSHEELIPVSWRADTPGRCGLSTITIREALLAPVQNTRRNAPTKWKCVRERMNEVPAPARVDPKHPARTSSARKYAVHLLTVLIFCAYPLSSPISRLVLRVEIHFSSSRTIKLQRRRPQRATCLSYAPRRKGRNRYSPPMCREVGRVIAPATIVVALPPQPQQGRAARTR